MTNLYSPKYEYIHEIIENMKNNGHDWEKILNSYENHKQTILTDDISKEIWVALVKEKQSVYYSQKRIEKGRTDATLVSIKEDNECSIPPGERSSWQVYRKKLAEKGFREESLIDLEENTIKILKKLSRNTLESGPIKGLVIGQVQSGKTASMAGLMAMAADWGWNMFIVLSGMIENLREQTQARLINDLNTPGNINWIPLNKLSKHTEMGQRVQNLHFNEDSPNRYLNVCLKNKTRLENLIAWFKEDPNKLQQMKILIIDDEADHGSINTNNIDEKERTAINKLIIELVNINSQGKTPMAVNYISYTATPYSNFLNESSDESLYPKDFIGVLPTVAEYFGPKQIFGGEDIAEKDEERLDIVRLIDLDDKEKIISVQKGLNKNIPRSLMQSICWFLNATAVMRYYGYNKPVSMLVHTSQVQIHHKNVAEAIANWITNTPPKKIMDLCEKFYEEEKVRFDINKFRQGFPDYPIPDEKLNDYPEFNLIKEHISDLINRITHIPMNEEGDLEYHKGIHLCIDNSSNTGINDENMHVRLAYPTSEQLRKLGTSPAFIIVGGSTLSRGLTLEGLVSTYFLRAATAGDSLMQMGRWFGFRRGYELLPRIWMTDNTFEKFQFLTTLEEELREELKEFEIGNKHPSEYGPRVKNTPKVSWLRITSRNKMQQAIEIDMDFSGASIQTIHFNNNIEELRNNIHVTENFLNRKCGIPDKSKITNSLVYRNIDFETIKNEFLLKMKFNERSRIFNDISTFCEWYEKVENDIGFDNWNIIVPSSGKIKDSIPSEREWRLGSYTLGKVNRSAKASSLNYGKDMVNIDSDEKNSKDFTYADNSRIKEIRVKYGLGNVPQLIIYRIDKNSKARQNNKNLDSPNRRMDLRFSDDPIGVYINVPGEYKAGSYAKALTIKMDNLEVDDFSEIDHQYQ